MIKNGAGKTHRGMEGIGRDHPVGEQTPAEQVVSNGNLLGLGIDAHLNEGLIGGMGGDTEHLGTTFSRRACTTDGLAIEGDGFCVGPRTGVENPSGEGPFELGGIQTRQETPVEGARRGEMTAGAKELTQEGTMITAPLRHRIRRVAAAQTGGR